MEGTVLKRGVAVFKRGNCPHCREKGSIQITDLRFSYHHTNRRLYVCSNCKTLYYWGSHRILHAQIYAMAVNGTALPLPLSRLEINGIRENFSWSPGCTAPWDEGPPPNGTAPPHDEEPS